MDKAGNGGCRGKLGDDEVNSTKALDSKFVF